MQSNLLLNDALSLGVISILITMKLCFHKSLFYGFIILVLLPQYVFMHLFGQTRCVRETAFVVENFCMFSLVGKGERLCMLFD